MELCHGLKQSSSLDKLDKLEVCCPSATWNNFDLCCMGGEVIITILHTKCQVNFFWLRKVKTLNDSTSLPLRAYWMEYCITNGAILKSFHSFILFESLVITGKKYYFWVLPDNLAIYEVLVRKLCSYSCLFYISLDSEVYC